MPQRIGFSALGYLAIGLALVFAAAGPVVGQDGLSSLWTPGRFWNHSATVQFESMTGGREINALSQFIVLGKASTWLGVDTWALAVIREGSDGRRRLSLLRFEGAPAFSMRWPVIVDALPGVETQPSHSITPYLLSGSFLWPTDQPIQIERVDGTVYGDSGELFPMPEWLSETGYEKVTTESLTLIPGGLSEITTPAGALESVQAVSYAWRGRSQVHTGEAHWSYEMGWWVLAEGSEGGIDGTVTFTYRTELLEAGQMDGAALAELLADVIDEMVRSSDSSVASIQSQIQALGLEL